MTIHTLAAEIESKLPELIHDSPLNRRLYLETTLFDFQKVIEARAVMESCRTMADALEAMHDRQRNEAELNQQPLGLS